MVALKHLKRSNMFRSIYQIIFRELVHSLLKSLIKTVKGQFWRCGSISVNNFENGYINISGDYRLIHAKSISNCTSNVLTVGCVCVTFSVGRYVGWLRFESGSVCYLCYLKEGVCVTNLLFMLERFKCFNATILD
jgi:hypothetical protein